MQTIDLSLACATCGADSFTPCAPTCPELVELITSLLQGVAV